MKPFARYLFRARLAAILFLFCGGCLGQSSPVEYYYLGSPERVSGEGYAKLKIPEGDIVAVGPIALPPGLEQTGIAVKGGKHRIKFSRTRVWAAPLDELMAAALVRNLSGMLTTDRIETYPGRRFAEVRYQIELSVAEFGGRPGEHFDCVIIWTLSNNRQGRIVAGKRFERRMVPEGGGYEAYVAAASRSLAELAAEIAAALSAEVSR